MLETARLLVDGKRLFDKEEQALEDVLNFEIQLAEISTAKEERRNQSKLYNPTTAEEIGKLPE